MSNLFEPDELEQIVMAAAMRQTLIDYSGSSLDAEVCGLIGGLGEHAQTFYPVKNIAPDPGCNYFMDPREQITAMRAMREHGEALLAIFHSHPNSAAEPSPTDLALAAYPGTAYLIASLKDFDQPQLAAFLFDKKAFSALPLIIVE